MTDVGDVALWTGLTLGAAPAVTAACAPLWGRIGDRFGNKLLVQRSLLSFVFVLGAMAFVTRAWHLLVLRAVQGFLGGYGSLTLAMASTSVPRERMADALGGVQTAQRLGPAIGPVIGGVLAAAVGQRRAFLVAAGVYLVAFVLLTVMYHEPATTSRAARAHGRVTFTDILALENFVLLMALIFGLQIVERSFGPILPLYLERLGFGSRVELWSGVLFSAIALGGAAGHQLAAALLTRVSARAVSAGAVLSAAAALAGFAIARSPWVLSLTMAALGLGIGTAMTAAFTAAGAVIPREAYGTSFGFLTSASLVGLAAGPTLGGLVAARSLRAVFVVGSVTLAILAITVRRLMVERPLHLESAPTEEA